MANSPFTFAVIGRPKKHVRLFARDVAVANKLDILHPFLGMHVRQGDKWTEASLLPFSACIAN